MASEELIERLRYLLRPLEEYAGAAVVVLLRRKAGDLQLLLVKRATNPSDPWSGNMALPGGRRNPEDRDLKATVIRETWEETGIDLNDCRFIGTLDTVTSSRAASGLVVLPFVAVCEETPKVRLNKELCTYFWFPLSRLKSSEGTAVVEGLEVPAYLVDGEVVWGLTYRVLKNLLEIMEKAAKP